MPVAIWYEVRKNTMNRTSFSVKAILRKDKQRKDKKCPVNIRVTLNSKVVKLPTGKYLLTTDWNDRRSEPKNQVQCGLLNKMISKLETFILEESHKECGVSIDGIKEFWSNKKEDADCFFAFANTFLKLKKPEIEACTYQCYKNSIRYLRIFCANAKLSKIDLDFLKNFNYFLIAEHNLSPTAGAWKIHKDIKSILNDAYRREKIAKNPYVNFPLKTAPAKIKFLTIDEITAIEELDLSDSPELDLTRDKFLFACYTGLRFSDMARLSPKNIDIKEKLIRLEMKKTRREVVIPINTKTDRIIQSYLKPKAETLFPFVSNQKVNQGLKKIALFAGIDKTVTYHLARHSYGHVLGGNNVSGFAIQTLMGHSKPSMTSRYVNFSPDSLRSAIQGVSFLSS